MKTIKETLLFVAIAATLSSCETQIGFAPKPCKIEPPPTVFGTSKEGAAKVAAGALGASVANGEISTNYKGVVNQTYATVAQDDTAFFLLMQAYACEINANHTQAAQAIMQTAREELARRHNAPIDAVADHPTTLTPTENGVLSGSPLKQEISNIIAAPKPQ